MKSIKKPVVKLCDITLCMQENSKLRGIWRTLISDPNISEEEYSLNSGKMRRSICQEEIKRESADEFELKQESEEDNDFKEIQEEEETEEDNSFKENQEASGLSEYEKMVQKNREERQAFLRSLQIDEVKEEFKLAVKSLEPRPKTGIKRPSKKHSPSPAAPTRKSRRLAKLDIDLSEDALYYRAVAEAKIEARVETQLPPPVFPFEEALLDKDDYSVFNNDFKFDSKKDVKTNSGNILSCLKSMTLDDSCIAKVVPVRITALTVHPTSEKIIVIAGSKYGDIGFWNVTSESNPIVFHPHIRGVTCLKTNPHNPHQIFSSSYDGTVRCADMEKKVFQEVYNVSEETCCTHIDFVSPSTFLVSQRDGFISIVDTRSEKLKGEKKHECDDHNIKTVSIHPVNKNFFVTAGTSPVVKLWDLRKLQKKCLIDITFHKKYLMSAYFSPITGNSILSTSHDDNLGIFDSSNLQTEITFKKSIKHNNWTGRWLTPFKATWLPFSEEYFVIGSMQQQRQIQIYSSTGGLNIYNFEHEDFNSVTSLNEFHPTLNVLAGGNSSGKVYVFKDNDTKF